MPTYNQLFHTHSLNIQHWLAFPKKLNVSKKELKFLFHLCENIVLLNVNTVLFVNKKNVYLLLIKTNIFENTFILVKKFFNLCLAL